MSMKLPPFFYRETQGIRVSVRPFYLRDESKPERGQFVFGYAVRIENIGREPAQLLRRRWLIHDSIGEDTEVEGEGVIGEQPMIEPGRIHEYRSFCILKSPSGYMEGQYYFVRADSTPFAADIPRFILDARALAGPPPT
jgi:ApaG protein